MGTRRQVDPRKIEGEFCKNMTQDDVERSKLVLYNSREIIEKRKIDVIGLRVSTKRSIGTFLQKR